jgi:L-seryl-tRNA(Ser) seleniumtransferase
VTRPTSTGTTVISRETSCSSGLIRARGLPPRLIEPAAGRRKVRDVTASPSGASRSGNRYTSPMDEHRQKASQGHEALRALPKVDELLAAPAVAALAAGAGRTLVVAAVRETIEAARDSVKRGAGAPADWPAAVAARVAAISGPSLKPVVNATGIIVHTNLGRSVLPPAAIERMATIAGRYSNLELDLATGKRGSRQSHVEPLLTRLSGAEAAMAVNNNAAAVLLVLAALARRKEVIVSRGQLVEIGGSFRVPDIMRESGARLVEVGTTNRTRLSDYRGAIGPRTGMLLKVHSSNFRVVGFTEEVSTAELARLGRETGVPVVEDQGSGVLVPLERYGLAHEPTVGEAIEAGADLVTCSGDKLLGGPQAGLIFGRKELVDKLKKHPLARAVRCDKTSLAALEATLALFLDPDTAGASDPTLAMLAASREELRPRCEALAAALAEALGPGFDVSVRDDVTLCGGGALPTEEIETVVVAVGAAAPGGAAPPGAAKGGSKARAGGKAGASLTRMEAQLRQGHPAVVARVKDDKLLFDTRTMLDGDDVLVVRAMRQVAADG